MSGLADALSGALSPEVISALQDTIDKDTYGQSTETISAAGALSVTKKFSLCSVTGTTAYTLANGTSVGQTKVVICTAGASTPNATVTPASALGYTSVSAIGAVGDIVTFVWTGAAWAVQSQIGCTVS